MFRWTLILTAAATALLIGAAGPIPRSTGEPQRLVRAVSRDGADLALLERLSTNMWSCEPSLGQSDWQMTDSAIRQAMAAGIKCTILVKDVDALIAAEARRLHQPAPPNPADGAATFFDEFRDLAAVHGYVDTLVNALPAYCSRLSAGTSIEARDIPVLKIAKPGSPADKPALLITGTQHAREWLSPMTVMYIADQIVNGATSNARIITLLDRFVVYIAPTVNPDGYAYTWVTGTGGTLPNRLWRKNKWRNASNTLRGVDLNRNWSYQWGGEGASTNQSSETYRGTAAFSEPETQAIRDFVSARPEIADTIDFHTYGPYVLSPWGYAQVVPAEHPRLADLNLIMKNAVIAETGRVYTVGAAYTTLYPASGVIKDWMYGARGITGWTVELQPGDGTQIPGSSPPQYYTGFVASPAQIVPSGREGLAAFLAMSEAVWQPLRFRFFPSPLPNLLAPDTATTTDVEITGMAEVFSAGAGPRCYTRVGLIGQWSEQFMVQQGPAWRATLPPARCGAAVQVYFAATKAAGGDGLWPPEGAARPFMIRTGTPNSNICARCLGDITLDGFSTGEDFDLFVQAFFNRDRTVLGALIADIATGGTGAANPDGQLTGEDFDLFVQSFFVGCP